MARPIETGRVVTIIDNSVGLCQGIKGRVIRSMVYSPDWYWVQLPQPVRMAYPLIQLRTIARPGAGRPVSGSVCMPRKAFVTTRSRILSSKTFLRRFHTAKRAGLVYAIAPQAK